MDVGVDGANNSVVKAEHMPELAIETLELLRYGNIIVLASMAIAAVVLWFSGIAPALLRLGMGLARRRVAIFAKGDVAGSLKSLLLDSGLFRERNLVLVGYDGDIEKGRSATLFVVYWPDWTENVEEILGQKRDSAALIVYAPQDMGSISKETLAILNKKRNVVVCNFRGRLLNDIVVSMITTSYEAR